MKKTLSVNGPGMRNLSSKTLEALFQIRGEVSSFNMKLMCKSCTPQIKRVIQAWRKLCKKQTGREDSFLLQGLETRIHLSRLHPDGHVSGTCWRDGRVVGSFRIYPEGYVNHLAPRILREASS